MSSGSQSFTDLTYHIIFSTKHRNPIIDLNMMQQIRKHFLKKAGEIGIFIHITNGHLDHIHTLISIPAKLSVSEAIRLLKGYSSYHISDLQWQAGYAAFTVSLELFDRTFRYIKNQNEHHSAHSVSRGLKPPA